MDDIINYYLNILKNTMEIKKIGMFQMPTDAFEGDFKKINEFIEFWNEKWDWDDSIPLNKAGKGMRTYLVNRKILSEVLESRIYPGLSNNFERKLYLNNCINICLSDYKKNKEKVSDEIIFNAFNSIQYWGAITGRTFYQRNGLDESNIENFKKCWTKSVKPFYLSILNEISTKEINLCNLIPLFENIEGVGVSFGTKHLHFWSKAFGKKNPLPIYDKNIFQLLRAEIRDNRYPTWSQYLQVVQEFEKLAIKLNKTSESIEKALFAYYAKVGISPNNKVPKEFQKDSDTKIVNEFLNTRLLSK